MTDWIFILLIGGWGGPSDPYIIRDLTEAQCQQIVEDFATSNTFAACYATDGSTIKGNKQ